MRLKELEKEMPILFLHMMADLRTTGCDSVRDFIVVSNASTDELDQANRTPVRGFIYIENEYKELRRYLGLLITDGYISSVISGDTLVYRMSEDLTNYLLRGWPERRWPED